MANNRMYLCCIPCAMNPEISFEDSTCYLAKYYPTTGWFIYQETEAKTGPQLNEFFEKHRHGPLREVPYKEEPEKMGSLFGEEMILVYETGFGAGKQKAEILRAVTKIMPPTTP